MPVLLIFAVLCAWEGSQWLLPALALDPLPFAWVSAAAFALIAMAAGTLRPKSSGSPGRRAEVRLAAGGALALGVPALLLAAAQRYFAAEVAAAALAGVPVVIVVAAQVTSATDDDAGEALLPAIAGLGGALLLIPVRLPASSNGWTGFALDLLAVLLAGIFSVLVHRTAQALPRTTAVASIAIGNFLALVLLAAALSLLHLARLGVYTALTAPMFAATLAVEALTALAATFLLRELPPLALSTRFLIVPLLGAVEAYLLLRPTLSLRALSGAVLMALSATLLLRQSPRKSGSVVPLGSGDDHLFDNGRIR